MASFEPREPYTAAELSRLYPSNLQLHQVQILLRHGERTPVNARFQNTGLQGFWPYCRSVRQLRSAVLDAETNQYTPFEWRRRLETFGHKDQHGQHPRDGDTLDLPVLATGPGGEVDNICDMGSLTDRGRQTTFDLGRRLRDLYVDRLGFLPASIDSHDGLYLRSTPVPRALESLQQAFAGLYPPDRRGPDFPPPTVLVRSPQDETLFPNDSNCRRFAALSRAFAQRTADRWNDSPEMGYVNARLGRWMPPDSPRVAVDSRPRLSGVMDTINATRAHGPATRLPPEFYDARAIEIIERIAVEEWYGGYRESEEYRTLGIGGLLGDVVARMVGSAEHAAARTAAATSNGAVPVRLGLSGCHDTTLAAAMTSLGAFGEEGKWPQFTSHVAIEMFREEKEHDGGQAVSGQQQQQQQQRSASGCSWMGSLLSFGKSTSQGIGRKPYESLSPAERSSLEGYYVRVRYNDEPVTIPGCRAAGNHLPGDESFCTLAAFKSVVDKFTPKNWKQQCSVDPSAPVFPDKPQVAGY